MTQKCLNNFAKSTKPRWSKAGISGFVCKAYTGWGVMVVSQGCIEKCVIRDVQKVNEDLDKNKKLNMIAKEYWDDKKAHKTAVQKTTSSWLTSILQTP